MAAITFLHLQPNATRTQADELIGEFNKANDRRFRVEKVPVAPGRWEVHLPSVAHADGEDATRVALQSLDPEWAAVFRVTGSPSEELTPEL